MILTHNKKHFYKYTSADSGELVLESSSIKVTRASAFNDPFDTFQKLYLEFEASEATELFISKFRELVKNRLPIELVNENRFGYLVNYMIQHLDFKEPDMSGVKEILDKRIEIVNKVLEESNSIWFKFLTENRAFCMSECYDNLLMWSHYADSHKGIVIRFRVIPEIQSPFCAASPMIYADTPPTLGTFDDLFYKTIGAVKEDIHEINKRYSFTKSTIWSYEKEWRFTVKQLNPDQDYDIIRIDPREIDGIFLGCRIS